jgi:hypothetical protein
VNPSGIRQANPTAATTISSERFVAPLWLTKPEIRWVRCRQKNGIPSHWWKPWAGGQWVGPRLQQRADRHRRLCPVERGSPSAGPSPILSWPPAKPACRAALTRGTGPGENPKRSAKVKVGPAGSQVQGSGNPTGSEKRHADVAVKPFRLHLGPQVSRVFGEASGYDWARLASGRIQGSRRRGENR